MWILHVFAIGLYHILLWPFHILLWSTGYLIRDKVRSPAIRSGWLLVLVLGLILCQVLCEWVITGYDRRFLFIAIVILLDLLMGYGIFGILRLFRRLADWIIKENQTAEEESL